jgi:hypothetical protein
MIENENKVKKIKKSLKKCYPKKISQFLLFFLHVSGPMEQTKKLGEIFS